VNAEHAPKNAAAKTGLFATLSNLLRGQGTSAPSSRPHGRRPFIALTLAIAALLALTAAPASAVQIHAFSNSFGAAGSGPGQLSDPTGVAVDNSAGPAAGDVYVADAGNHRIDQFDSSGAFIRAWGWGVADGLPAFETCTLACQAGISGSGPGQFETPTFIAVDSSSGASAGDVYVGDSGTQLVQKFDSSGALVASWGDSTPTPNGQLAGTAAPGGPFSVFEGVVAGIAIDAGGNLWVENTHDAMFEFDESAAFLQEWGAPGHKGAIAIDSAQNIYLGGGNGAVTKLSASGENLGQLTRAEGEAGLPPTGLAVDPTSDDLYIDVGAAIEHIAPSCNPANGVCPVSESFGSPQLIAGAGLAVDASNGAVYAADTAANQIDRFVSILAATTEAASDVTATTATLHGTVNPEGSPVTECFFEYGTETIYGQSVPCAETPAEIGSGSSEVEVHADLSELSGGTTYHFRLIARNAQGSARGEDAELTTLPIPTIDAASATNLTATSVDLNARINPQGLDTTYHFEWGTTSSYGNSVPVPDEDIGAGSADRAVTQHIVGLSAETTYHWRILAKGTNGTTTSPDHTFVFHTGGGALPDNRGYELVTPSQKNGALIGGLFLGNIPPPIAEDGERMMALSVQCFAGAQSCVGTRQQEGEPYEFTRTENGWVTHPMAPPATVFQSGSSWTGLNPDTGMALFNAPGLTEAGEHFYARQLDGSFQDVGPVGAGNTGYSVLKTETFVSTGDLSHIVYSTGVPVWPFDAGVSNASSLYEYVGTGNASPSLVGVSGGPGSTDLISACGTSRGTSAGNRNNYGTLSEDGRTVSFTASPCASGTGANAGMPVPAYQLYARIDAAQSVLVSERTPASCTTPACQGSAPADAGFEGASRDGSRVFFTDTQQLTDDASQDSQPGDSAFNLNGCTETAAGSSGCNLYESECPDHCSDPAQRRLFALSAGDLSGAGPRVQGVVAISPDGSHVYFVAKGVLTATPNGEGQSAQNGAANLYLYQRDAGAPAGQLAFVTTLAATDAEQWREGVGRANLTPDGRFLVFTSHRALTPDATRPEGPQQVYRYDAQTGALIRISIGEQGFNDNGNAGSTGGPGASIVRADSAFRTGLGSARPDPTMSHDGAYVFFQSPIALTPRALDQVQVGVDESAEANPVYAQNVYEYHDGHVYLISDGKDVAQPGKTFASSTELFGADASGENVFFATSNQLVPQDTDTARDYYDARVGGGFPFAAPVPGCQGESCKGEGTAQPQSQSAGSGSFSGPSNPKPRHAKKSHHKKKHKKKAHKRTGHNRGGQK
jgi:hypothetical protein